MSLINHLAPESYFKGLITGLHDKKVEKTQLLPLRISWDAELQECFFSIVDVCGVLTEQKTSRGASNYWAVLKNRLVVEGA